MSSHRIVVVRGPKGCKVVPGSQPGMRGDEFIFKAVNTDVILHFPDKNLFNRDVVFVHEGNAETLTASKEIEPGCYPYSAYCVKSKAYAVGNSEPEIIIE